MKHSKIIQETLDKKTSKKEKSAYFIYAYKEWIIGLLIAFVLILTLSYSFFSKENPDLTVRVVSYQYLDDKEINELKQTIQEKSSDKHLNIDIQNFLVSEPSHRQIMVAQVAAKQIDLYITPKDDQSDLNNVLKKIIYKKDLFKLESPFSSYTVSQVIHAPHNDKIAELNNSK